MTTTEKLEQSAMSDFDLHGPWTGNALHVPAPHPRYSRARRNARTIRVFLILAVLAVVIGALWGLSHA